MTKSKSKQTYLLLIAILAVSAIIGCRPPVGDTIAPTVDSTAPIQAATGLAINGTITATFSEAMNPLSINAETFTLAQGTTAVTGTVAYAGLTAVFAPGGNLAASTAYTATITTGATDLAGNALESAFVWTFTTGLVADTTAPTACSTAPIDAATDIAVTANVTAAFCEAMDPTTISATTFTLKRGTTAVAGTVTFAGSTATFNPTANLANGTVYTATITTGAKDLAGNALAANKVWSFTTIAAPDTTAPTVSSTVPAVSATGVASNANITATFSEAMDPLSINTAAFTLKQGTTPVSGTVAYAGTTATFNPDASLAFSTVYTATMRSGVEDLAGNNLVSDKVWSFTIGVAPDTTAPTVSSTVPVDTTTGIAVNADITAIFSEAMDPLTITTTTFTLKQGTTPVTGTVIYGGTTATFNPSSSLGYSTVYTATITTGAKDLADNALAANKVWTFTTGAAPDTTAPTVLSTIPTTSATGVLISSDITATFSEAMGPLTITTATFTLRQGLTAVAGTVTYAGTTATFNPDSNLAGSTVYTAMVSTGAQDLAGNALAANKVWTFTTADIAAPTVLSTLPADAAPSVAINSNITATFSEAMNSGTIASPATTFTISGGVTGTVTYSGTTATFNPSVDLANSTTYTATISTGAQDLAGNGLAVAKVWSFTTSAAPDSTAPTVLSTVPADLATGVLVGANVTATFSEAMDPLTITTTTFTLAQGVTPVTGTVTYAGTTATFNPGSSLAGSTVYTATITTGAQDLAGNALAAAEVWTFTTESVVTNPTAVNLGTAGNFVILAKTGISTVPASAITGDIGASPVATSFITGFSLTLVGDHATSTQVTGSVYGADMAVPTPSNLTTAVLNMEAAYTDAAGRATSGAPFLNLGSGNIGGMTLTRGVYTWGSGVTIPTDVTISGGATDVWIFQIAGNLLVSSGVNVTLSGGAQAKNIFWQLAGQATLGTTSHFEGIILSQTGITLQTGASMNGRALAQSLVALDQNAVTEPTP